MKIYIKLKQKPNSIQELISELYSYETALGNFKSVTTYKDEECTILECMENKYRSADDIVDFVQTYFPEADEKTIFNILLNLEIIYNDRTYRIQAINCLDILRPTVCFVKSVTPFFDNLTTTVLVNSRYKNWGHIRAIAGYEFKR